MGGKSIAISPFSGRLFHPFAENALPLCDHLRHRPTHGGICLDGAPDVGAQLLRGRDPLLAEATPYGSFKLTYYQYRDLLRSGVSLGRYSDNPAFLSRVPGLKRSASACFSSPVARSGARG